MRRAFLRTAISAGFSQDLHHQRSPGGGTPMIANGKVYLGTTKDVTAFGPLEK
jgi:hypothetical protein